MNEKKDVKKIDTKCFCKYCETEVDGDLDTMVLAWYNGIENFHSRDYEEMHFFCSFKCATDYMQQCEYGE